MEQFLKYKKISDIKEKITDKQFVEINKLFLWYDTTTIKNRLQNIRDFILNGVESKWLGRLRIITKKLKNDVISEYSCRIRYGDKWKEKQDLLKEKVKMDKNNFIKKYGKELGIEKWKERNNKTRSYGLESAIMRYGKIEGVKKWEETLRRKLKTMSEMKKIRPYRNGRTLPEYQQRYGVEIGFQKWKKRNINQKHRFSIDYFLQKFGKEQGLNEWNLYCESMRKTTLKSFIDRYGDEIGTKRYNIFVERMKYVQSENFFTEKYGEEVGKIKFREFLISKISNFKDKYSKISQNLFWGIYENLNEEQKSKCYFYELNQEYSFYVWKKEITLINVDFKLKNKIIEFDGDYWHSKKEQIIKDNLRDEYLKEKGYFIKRVKEIEFRKNKELVINECLNFLKNE